MSLIEPRAESVVRGGKLQTFSLSLCLRLWSCGHSWPDFAGRANLARGIMPVHILRETTRIVLDNGFGRNTMNQVLFSRWSGLLRRNEPGNRRRTRTVPVPAMSEVLESRTLLSGFAVTPVVVSGDPAPGLAGAVIGPGDGTGGVVGIGDGTCVAFSAPIVGGGVTSSDNRGLWVGGPGSLALVYQKGDPAPGSTSPFYGTDIFTTPVVTGAGALAVVASVSLYSNHGLWAGVGTLALVGPPETDRWPAVLVVSPTGQVPYTAAGVVNSQTWNAIQYNEVDAVRRQGQDQAALNPFPPELNQADYDAGYATFAFDNYQFSAYPSALNANNEIPVDLQIPGAVLPGGGRKPSYEAIRLVSPAGWGQEVLRLGSNTNYQLDSICSLNNAGQVLLNVTLRDSGRKALVLASNNSVQPVLFYDDPLPGTSTTLANALPANGFALGGGGDVAFKTVIGQQSGIWAGQPGSVQLVAMTGQPAPGLAGGTISSVSEPDVNAQGIVAFSGMAHTSDHPYLRCIWAGTPGNLKLAIAEQQTLLVRPGDAETIVSLWTRTTNWPSGGQDGRAKVFNDQGFIGFNAQTYDTATNSYVTGGFVLDLNHPILGTASVSGRVWNDADKNGIQGAAEGGVAGAQVSLFSSNDQQVGSTATTASDGTYSFTGLAGGNYYIKVVAPPLCTFTIQGAGTSATGSDVNPNTGQSAVFSLADGQQLVSEDAGLIADQPPQGSLGTPSIDIAKPDIPQPDDVTPDTFVLNVVYTDDLGVNVASLDNSYLELDDSTMDLHLQAAPFIVLDQTNPCRVYFQYRLHVFPSDWREDDIGETLSVTVMGGPVDTSGQPLADSNIGGLVIGLHDTTPPQVLSVTGASGLVGVLNATSGFSFAVEYSDNVGLDSSSISGSNLVFHQRDGNSVVPVYFNGSTPADNSYQKITYDVPPPSFSTQFPFTPIWAPIYQGIYDLQFGSSQVHDWAGLPVANLPSIDPLIVDFTPPTGQLKETSAQIQSDNSFLFHVHWTDALSGFAPLTSQSPADPLWDSLSNVSFTVGGLLLSVHLENNVVRSQDGKSLDATYQVTTDMDKIVSGNYTLKAEGSVEDWLGNQMASEVPLGVIKVGDLRRDTEGFKNGTADGIPLGNVTAGDSNGDAFLQFLTTPTNPIVPTVVAAGNRAAAPAATDADASYTQRFTLSADSATLGLDYRFTNGGNGDRIVLSVNGQQVYSALGTDSVSDTYLNTGPIDIKRFAGKPADVEIRLASAGLSPAAMLVDNLIIAALPPDLCGTTLAATPLTALAGSRIALKGGYQVANSDAWQGFAIQYHLSKDKIWGNADDIVVNSNQNISAAADTKLGKHNLAANLTLPHALGAYYILARLDSGENIVETNENNNVIVGSKLTVRAPAVQVLAGTRKTNVVNGQTIPIAFGSPKVGAKPPVWVFTVKNAGTAPLTLSRLRLPAGFKLIDGLVASLLPGGSDTLTVQLPTTRAGVYQGNISFTTNDADKTPFSFAISGSVLAARKDRLQGNPDL